MASGGQIKNIFTPRCAVCCKRSGSISSINSPLKEINGEDILEILEAHCHSFESDGEFIHEEFEDEIYSEIKALLN